MEVNERYEYERRRDTKELYTWMGSTTRAIANIEVSHKELSHNVGAINNKINQAIVCPYSDEIKGIRQTVKDCNSNRSALNRDRKYIYSGFILIMGFLGTVARKVWH